MLGTAPIFLVWAIFSSLFNLPSARADTIVLDENLVMSSIGDKVLVLEDKNKSYSIDEILSPDLLARFSPSRNKRIGFGFTSSAYWVLLSIENPYPKRFNWLLEISYPLLDRIELYSEKHGALTKKESGDRWPFAQREGSDRNFIFLQKTEPHSIEQYVLRVETSSSMNIPLKIWRADAFDNKTKVEMFIMGLFFGAIVIMILYNFLLYLSLRVATYLHYVLFVSASVSFLFTLSGLSYKFLWPNSVWLANNALPVMIFACNTFCVSFARSFLESRKDAPKIDKYLLVFIVVNATLLPLSPFIGPCWSIKLATFFAVLAALLVLLLSVQLSLYKKQARFYLLAWLLLIFGIVVYGLKSFGVLANVFVTEYSMYIGMLAEVILLSLGIADRINTIKKEHLWAQQRALQIKQIALEQQKLLTQAFERFVPKTFLKLLGKNSILDVFLGDHVQKNMTILFSDIRAFTNMSEKMTPNENFRFINSYLERMEPIVAEFGGITDKFIGDAVMALFEDTNAAVDAALAMLKCLQQYNLDRQKSGYEAIQVGIGINSGDLMLGTIGAVDRMDGTVIGDAVNLAARLESLTKTYKTSLLISDNTYTSLQDRDQYEICFLNRENIKGKSETVAVWEVRGYKKLAT